MERVFGICRVTKYVAPAICSPAQVFADRVVVFAESSLGLFALLCSSLHEAWVRKNASTFETRLTYTPTDAFETLPHPSVGLTELDLLGVQYAEQRERFCSLQKVGLTDFYNAFHDPLRQDASLVSMRELLVQIDHALLALYGWRDLDPAHDFHAVAALPANDRTRFTISEAARLEVLRRLAALNRQRYREEQEAAQSLQAALEERSAPRKRAGRPAAKKSAAPAAQTPLFD